MQDNFQHNGSAHLNGATMPVSAPESGNDFRKFIDKLIRNWYWFGISVFIGLVLAHLYLRYVSPDYKINAKILVEDKEKGLDIPGKDVLEQLDMFSSKSNADNEVEILKSRSLMEKVVKDLNLNTAYYAEGVVKKTELFSEAPFTFRWLYIQDSVKDATYEIQAKSPTTFTLKWDKRTREVKWNDTVHLKEGILKIERRDEYPLGDEKYRVAVTSVDNAVDNYSKMLDVIIPNKQVSTINLTMTSKLPEKGEKVLNTLLDNYQQASVNDKNRVADSTIAFIDARLVLVTQELSGVEKDIQQFKQDNQLADIQEQSKALVAGTEDFARQLTDQQVRLSVVSSLQQYLKDDQNNKRVMPSTLIVQDPSFMGLIEKYNTLQMERERQLMSNTENNPVVRNLDQQIANLRIDLISNIATLKRGIEVSIKELESRNGVLNSKIREVPGKERIFLDYSRQQEVKQDLYLFLLKKREESAISKTSNIAIARIIDVAKSDATPFKPSHPVIYLFGIILGLGLPISIIYLMDLFNTRITQRADITSALPLPILAEIGHSPKEAMLVVGKNTHTSLAEQFRSLRTNLQFIMAGSEKKVILLTSSMSGEGKSFIAVNLATIMAMSGKKVVLVEMDLRKPKISERLGLNNNTGFSTYMIGRTDLESLVKPSGVHEDFWIVPSGPVPPNPAELMLMEKTTTFFNYLREEFDYVIIDSAPIGLVTDAQLLSRFADTSMYVVRMGFTFKQQLYFCKDLYTNKKLPSMGLVINDVKVGSGYGYGGYSYAYGSGYGYVEAPKSMFTKIKKSFTSK